MFRQVQKKFLKQAGREYRPEQRMLALAFEAVLFLFILPYTLIRIGSVIDRLSGLPLLVCQPINSILGWLVLISGWMFAMWSISVQFTIGKGTPVPLMATQKLIIQPPYSYCRNPMALGAIGMYLGISILVGSIGALLLVILGAVWLLTYIKRVEEKEMELRFGQEYLVYRQQTPFLFPRLR